MYKANMQDGIHYNTLAKSCSIIESEQINIQIDSQHYTIKPRDLYTTFLQLGRMIQSLSNLIELSIIRTQGEDGLYEPLLILNLPCTLRKLKITTIAHICPVLLNGIEELCVQQFSIYRIPYQIIPNTLKVLIITKSSSQYDGIIVQIRKGVSPIIVNTHLLHTYLELGFDTSDYTTYLENMKLEYIVVGWNLNFDNIQYLGG